LAAGVDVVQLATRGQKAAVATTLAAAPDPPFGCVSSAPLVPEVNPLTQYRVPSWVAAPTGIWPDRLVVVARKLTMPVATDRLPMTRLTVVLTALAVPVGRSYPVNVIDDPFPDSAKYPSE
jgi:hypothetical protein